MAKSNSPSEVARELGVDYEFLSAVDEFHRPIPEKARVLKIAQRFLKDLEVMRIGPFRSEIEEARDRFSTYLATALYNVSPNGAVMAGCHFQHRTLTRNINEGKLDMIVLECPNQITDIYGHPFTPNKRRLVHGAYLLEEITSWAKQNGIFVPEFSSEKDSYAIRENI